MLDQIPQEWADPPKIFRPFVRWWWPGIDVEPNELRRELEELDTQYFGGAEIQPFLFGLPREIHERNEYLHRFAPNPFFYEMLKVVLQEAQRRGLTIDLTVGSAWPPGGNTVKAPESLKTLLFGTGKEIITGGMKVEREIPPMDLPPYYRHEKLMASLMGPIFGGFFRENFRRVALCAMHPSGNPKKPHFIFPKGTQLDAASAVDLSNKIQLVDGQERLVWDAPPGKWQLFSFYAGPCGMSPMNDARPAQGEKALVIDMFSEPKVHQFLTDFLGPALPNLKPYLGNTLRALFTDSQEIACEWFWAEDFFEEFLNRRGYDVRPYLPVCYVPNRDNQFVDVFFKNEKPCYDFPGDMGKRIRYDWLLTLSELWADRYCKGISRWGSQYGIQHRIQTYGVPLDLLMAYAASDIPETEQLFAGGLLDFLKLAGSAGIIFNKSVVSCEAMVWRGYEHAVSPLRWKVAADRLFVAGINQMIYHGFPYAHPLAQYPSYDPWGWCSGNLNRNNSYWQFFPQLNAYVARAQYLLRQGTTHTNIGIFYPFWNYDYKALIEEDLVGGYLPGFDDVRPGGLVVWYSTHATKRIDKLTRAQQQLGTDLMDHGYYYTQFNEQSLLASEIKEGKLCMGSAKLEALIFLDIEALSLPAIKKLQAVAAAGVKIVFIDQIPHRQPGFLGASENDKEIQQILKSISLEGNQPFNNPNTHDEKLGHILLNSLKIMPGLRFSTPQPSIRYIHKSTYFGELYFIRHGSPEPLELECEFPPYSEPPVVFDLWDGKIFKLPNVISKNNGYRAKIQFPAYGSLMLFFPSSPYPQPLTEMKNAHCVELVKAPTICILESWEIHVEDRNSDGSPRIFDEHLPSLCDWRKHPSLKYCCGPGTYSCQFTLESRQIKPKSRIFLDLGRVFDATTVKLNGTILATLLCPPYSLDITSQIQEGTNELYITITGPLRNRLVGYGQKDPKYAGQKKKPLFPCGLLGPVAIKTVEQGH